MKRLIFIFFMCPVMGISQWIVNDTLLKVDSIFEIHDFEVKFDASTGVTSYCGLEVFDTDFDFVPTYYRLKNRSDLIYVNKISLIDSSLVTGFWQLRNFKLETCEYEKCWVKDYVWSHYDKNRVLVKQVFYNSGLVIDPQKFFLVYPN